MSLNYEANPSKDWVDHVNLISAPYNLSPMLNSMLERQISKLISNYSPDVYFGLVKDLKDYARFKNIKFVATACWGCSLPVEHKGRMQQIVRRCVIGKFWKRFTRKALRNVMSAEVKEASRQYRCPPIGFVGHNFYCRSPFCPNCHMRRANGTRKDLLKEARSIPPEKLEAIIVNMYVPFKEQMFGYTPAVEPKLLEKIRNRLNVPYFGCRTIGVEVLSRKPYTTTTVALFVNKKHSAKVIQTLKKMKLGLLRQKPEITIELNELVGLDNICLALYDHLPLSLAGVSKEGFSDAVLQHTLDEYKCSTRNKKRTLFFGSRSL